MPTVREIEQALFDLAPKDGAMVWDNVGQLLGDPEQAVEKVLVALDITGSLKFVDCGTDGIFAFPIDVRKARQGVIPVIW